MTRILVARLRLLAVCLSVLGPASACSDPTITTEQPASAPASFVNKVWRVTSSSSVETGGLYVFLSDGTVVIASAHGTPAFGSWKPDGSRPTTSGLILVEEGRAYKVDVLKLSADEFRIMINNPGSAVEIAFAPADQPPRPPAPAPR